MRIENYEVILVKGEPKALTLEHKDCFDFGRFVSLHQNAQEITLTDASGKQLFLAPAQALFPLGESISVFALFSNGQTAAQSAATVE